MNATQAYSLGILAGGQGARWGGRDKGLIALRGQSLLAGIVHPRPTAVEEVLACCRSYPHFYQHFSDRILCEAIAGLGPCAGITALLSATTTSTLMVLPVDLIGSPQAIIQTLENEWRDDDTAIFLTDTEGRHSPCMRLHTNTLKDCGAFLDEGGRKITGLLEKIGARPVPVDTPWLRDADLPKSLAF